MTLGSTIEAWTLSSATVAAAIAGIIWSVRMILRAVRWVSAMHAAVLTLIDTQGKSLDLMAGKVSSPDISSRRTWISAVLLQAKERLGGYKG